MLDKSSREQVVSELALEMRDAITTLAGQRGWSETRERWLDRAARSAGITYRQARSLFYCEGNPRATLIEQVRAAVRRRQKEQLKEAREAYAALIGTIQRAQEALLIRDEDFHSVEIDGLREILGGAHSPLAGEKSR